MALKGDARHYGSVQVALHWTTAAAVLALLALGIAVASTGDPARQAALLRVHVPLGMLVLALTIVRVGWRLCDTRPDEPAGQPQWQAFTARGVHGLLYAVVMPWAAAGPG